MDKSRTESEMLSRASFPPFYTCILRFFRLFEKNSRACYSLQHYAQCFPTGEFYRSNCTKLSLQDSQFDFDSTGQKKRIHSAILLISFEKLHS